MLSLLKNLGGTWDTSRDGLYKDLESIEIILNRRWGATFGSSNTLGVASGGTGLVSVIQGDIFYGSATDIISALPKSTTATRYLSNTGTSNNPAWAQVDLTNGVTGTLPVTNGGTGTATAFTAGSVVFAGASGIYSQDNANFFWDDTNNRLGIGTITPAATLEVSSNITQLRLSQTGTGNYYDLYRDNGNGHFILQGSQVGANHIYLAPTSGNVVVGGTTNPVEIFNIDVGNGTGGLSLIGGGSSRFTWKYDGAAAGITQNILAAQVLIDTVGHVNISSRTNNPSGIKLFTNPGTTSLERVTINSAGLVGIGQTTPTALLHLKAGTAAANTAPLKFATGTSLTTAEVGVVEFTTDDLFFTITTGTARKAFILDDGARLTSGKIPVATTNGRLVDTTIATLIAGGVPALATSIALTNQGADIGATNFTNAGTVGTYRIDYTLEDTTADVTAGTVTLTIAWTDDAGATTVTAVQVLTATGRVSGVIHVQLASGNITYATTHTGIFAAAKYAVYATVTRLS